MRKLTKIFLVLAGLFITVSSVATPAAIGVIDMAEIMTSSPQTKKIKNKLDSEFQARKNDILSLQEDLKTKHSSFQRDKEILGENQLRRRDRDLLKLRQDIQRMQEDFQADVTLREREEMHSFEKVLKDAVDKVAKSDKYDLILSSQGTLYSTNSVDITSRVLNELKAMDDKG